MTTATINARWIVRGVIDTRGERMWRWEKEDGTKLQSETNFATFGECLDDARRHGLQPDEPFSVVIPTDD